MSEAEAEGIGSTSLPSLPVVMQSMQVPCNPEDVVAHQPAPAATTPTCNSPITPGIIGEGCDGVATVLPLGHGDPIKKKRGRPRKYGPDGSMALTLVSQPLTSPQMIGAISASPLAKKGRGRPPGSTSSKKKQLQAFGTIGVGFTPHVITVKAGEDVSSKIMSFSQHGPRAVCILSANGAISNVTLRQPATSGGTVTYEGRFEILSLSGSFLLTENEGQRSRTGGLSVSLSGPDGRVLGGSVAGLLTAASPVQVIVGSFIAEGQKESKAVTPARTLNMAVTPSSASPGMNSPASSGGIGSPIDHSSNGAQPTPSIWKHGSV